MHRWDFQPEILIQQRKRFNSCNFTGPAAAMAVSFRVSVTNRNDTCPPHLRAVHPGPSPWPALRHEIRRRSVPVEWNRRVAAHLLPFKEEGADVAVGQHIALRHGLVGEVDLPHVLHRRHHLIDPARLHGHVVEVVADQMRISGFQREGVLAREQVHHGRAAAHHPHPAVGLAIDFTNQRVVRLHARMGDKHRRHGILGLGRAVIRLAPQQNLGAGSAAGQSSDGGEKKKSEMRQECSFLGWECWGRGSDATDWMAPQVM